MRKHILLLSLLSSLHLASAQGKDPIINDLNSLFELRLDSLERSVTINKWGIDTSYYFHYSIKNISKDTLSYITNSCFYYNHSYLTIGGFEFDINPAGGCYCNILHLHILPPGASFNERQWVANNLNRISKGEFYATLLVRLVKDDKTKFRVDGRNFEENSESLTFKGQTKVVETLIDNRKRKKKSPKSK